ncbi:Solute carrier family 10 member 6 [Holothuria leucospilota]|uniref:Solute carrier family 10 member 6 n=1 Tax=Holothuria leucospilota TaxID=206669 RepID=A0A9Q1CMF5_HOLLE|nr:Solute carrier family 10 member 6 [Holothuria leucospilota]
MEATEMNDWVTEETPTESVNGSSFHFPPFIIWDGTLKDMDGFKIVCETLMAITAAAINLAMGTLLSRDEIKRQHKFPGSVLVGCFCQFLLLPFLVLGLVHILRLDFSFAIGMLMISVVPTSPIASLLTFFLDGNIYISVAMTIISTIMAVGMIPIVLFFISETLSLDAIRSPAYAIVVSFIHILIPLSIGILCRHFLKPTWNRLIILFGLSFGLAGFAANIVIQFTINKTLLTAPLNVFIALASLPVASYVLAYVVSFLAKQDGASRKALAISLVYHSMGIAILTLSSSDLQSKWEWKELTTFPSLYSPITSVYGMVGVLLYLVCFSRDRESALSGHRIILTGYQVIEDEEYPEPNRNIVMVKDENKIKKEDLSKYGLVGRGGEIMRIGSITMPTVTEAYTS